MSERDVTEESKGGRRGSERDMLKCKECKKTFSNITKVLSCERCQLYVCSSCLNIGSAEMSVIRSRPECNFLCSNCKDVGIKSMRSDKDIEERCKEYCSKLEARFDELDKKVVNLETGLGNLEEDTKLGLDKKADKKAIEELNEKVDNLNIQAGITDYDRIQEMIEKQIDDMRESERRKSNIVVYGVVELEDENLENRVVHDKQHIVDFVTKELGVEEFTVVRCFRLGKKPDKCELAGATAVVKTNTVRPLKVVLASPHEKSIITKEYWKCKQNDTKKLSYQIANDFTRAETAKHKSLLAKMKDMEKKGKKGLKIRKGKIVQGDGKNENK